MSKFAFQIVTMVHWLETGSAMTRLIMLPVTLMEEIAVDTISTLICALIVNAISTRLVLLALIHIVVSPLQSSLWCSLWFYRSMIQCTKCAFLGGAVDTCQCKPNISVMGSILGLFSTLDTPGQISFQCMVVKRASPYSSKNHTFLMCRI